MTIVIDASAAVSGLTNAIASGGWARDLLDNEVLIAPHHVHAEVANALRRGLFTGLFPPPIADVAQQEMRLLPITLEPFTPYADRIWELRDTVTPYDAWYVAVAEMFDVPLATLDARLAQAPGPRCRFLLPPTSTR